MLNVRPCNENNAIKVVAYALNFVHELDESYIKKAIDMYNSDTELNVDLTHVNPQQAFTIEINNGMQIQQESLAGVSFEKLNEKGEVIWSVILRKNELGVTCTEYTRWDNIWPQAKKYLSKLLGLLDGIEVSSITLEYADEFIITDHEQAWKEQLFKRNSRFLATNIFDLNDLWHSHHGYFTESKSPNVKNILNTINIGYISENPTGIKKIEIKSQHKSATVDIQINSSFLDDVFEVLIEENHIENKNILIDLLSDEMLKIMKLEN